MLELDEIELLPKEPTAPNQLQEVHVQLCGYSEEELQAFLTYSAAQKLH